VAPSAPKRKRQGTLEEVPAELANILPLEEVLYRLRSQAQRNLPAAPLEPLTLSLVARREAEEEGGPLSLRALAPAAPAADVPLEVRQLGVCGNPISPRAARSHVPEAVFRVNAV